MFTTEDGDVDSTSPNISTCQLTYSLSDEQSQGRQFYLEERGKEPVNILTTQGTDTEVNDQEQEDILDTETIDSTYLLSFRCILNEEDPDLDNPDLYNCKTCRKGLTHLRSRRLFPERNHCDELPLKNRDLGANQQNYECYDPRTQEASLASSTVDNPRVDIDDQQRSNAYHLQDGFSKINLTDENEIRPMSSASDEGYNDLAMTHKIEVKAGCPFKCKHCPKRFSSKENLESHGLVHGARAKFICNDCSLGFMIASRFKRHLKVHESSIDIKFPFKCDKCPKRYSCKTNLEKHALDHGAQARFNCEFCLKGFTEHSHFRQHLKVHESNIDIKFPFKCDKCPKRYSYKKNLEQHMLDHGAQARFNCDFCLKGFIVHSSLKEHLKVHESNVDVKCPFKCDKCPKQYSEKRYLENHTWLVHGGQAKFICDFCSKGFMTKSNLKRHLKVHKDNVDANFNPNVTNVQNSSF